MPMVEVRQHATGSYFVYVDHQPVAVSIWKWLAQWKARRIATRIVRGLYRERVLEP